MREYKVQSTDTKHFTLTSIDKEIGILKYANWFSFKAEIILKDNTTFQIEPKGFWGAIIELKQTDKVLLNFKMNWNGNIIIKTLFTDTKMDFIFKHKGILKSSYVLLDKDQQELAEVQPDFKWSKFTFGYNISTTDIFDNFDFKEIMLLTTIHCANYYLTMMTTALA